MIWEFDVVYGGGNFFDEEDDRKEKVAPQAPHAVPVGRRCRRSSDGRGRHRSWNQVNRLHSPLPAIPVGPLRC